jgi:predicted transcriptional regulator
MSSDRSDRNPAPSTGPTIGDAELLLLRHVAAARAPLSVAEVTEAFGAAKGLKRTTVLTMLERLRKKGFLSRRRSDGAYRYQATRPPADLLRGLVRSFVERTLQGNLQPFVSYLVEKEEDMSEAEVQELERLVARLREPRAEPRGKE